MTRRALAPLLLAIGLAAAPALAQSAGIGALAPGDHVSPLLSAFQAGIVCAQDTGETAPAPGTIAGFTNIITTEPDFVSPTRRVPAVLGIGFGVKSRARRPPGYDTVLVTVTHPPMGANGVTVETYITAIRGEDGTPGLSITLFQFDTDYELVTGPWTISASEAGKQLFHAKFTVLPPREVPELAQVCHYQGLLS